MLKYVPGRRLDWAIVWGLVIDVSVLHAACHMPAASSEVSGSVVIYWRTRRRLQFVVQRLLKRIKAALQPATSHNTCRVDSIAAHSINPLISKSSQKLFHERVLYSLKRRIWSLMGLCRSKRRRGTNHKIYICFIGSTSRDLAKHAAIAGGSRYLLARHSRLEHY